MTSIKPIRKTVKKEISLQRLNDSLVLAKSNGDQRAVKAIEKCINRIQKLKGP